MLQPGETLHGFTVRRTEELPEVDGSAIVMDHGASGAQLLYLQNDDENKAFSITFKTPPADDTGVFHILEHSVLCGSEKFPVKEPFVNLLRTSMQTFLNAMTFPDKTVYPVASTNEQDLLNLMDVYLDAVLHPALHTDRHIFEQEGWHYELTGEEDAQGLGGQQLAAKKLVYNGVVFNEMKGVLSKPDAVIERALMGALFPNSCYAFESGGHPRAIPQLTYEDYCDSHARHYRLDNSYIVLYGDMDIGRILEFLDSKYLGVAQAPAPGAPNPMGDTGAVLSLDNVVTMNTTPDNAQVSIGYAIGSAHDFERVLAVDILADALVGGNESPIKRAVLDSGLGGDCAAEAVNGLETPVLLFELKNAAPGAAPKFKRLVEEQVRKLCEEGIPRDLLEASLSQVAFALRERDRGMADGVVLAMSAMSGWLYNDDDATLYLHFDEPLASMRAGLDSGYFEDLLRSVLLDNNHVAMVDLQPKPEEGDGEEAAELAKIQATMSEADLSRVEEEVAALRERQEAPDSPEDVAKLPQLRLSDIGQGKPDPVARLVEGKPLPYLHYDLPTHRIAYVRHYFDVSGLDWEDLPYLRLLSTLLGKLDTSRRSAAELDVLKRAKLGRLSFATESISNFDNPEQLALQFVMTASALSEELDSLAAIPFEVLAQTRFTDASRIRDVLVQNRIAFEENILGNGHLVAAGRAQSYLFRSGVLQQHVAGLDFYRFLTDLLDHYDHRAEELCTKLAEVRDKVANAGHCIVSFTGSSEDFEAFAAANPLGVGGQPADGKRFAFGALQGIPEPACKREAFIIPSEVCYVAKAADVGRNDSEHLYRLLGRIMGFDYLWNEVRVKGGAYGVSFAGGRSGFARFASFRDPQLDDTLARYDAAAEWLAAFDPDGAQMEGYIVSSVATADAPTKPKHVSKRCELGFFGHVPEDWREQVRSRMLDATAADVRALAADLARFKDSQAVCVLGGADAVGKASYSFGEKVVLLKDA